MAERKAQNKYIPPDFDPSIHGSINRYRNTKKRPVVREESIFEDRIERKPSGSARKIRFEMPFNVRCEKCKNHIGMGVRFNAEKRAVDEYFSTTIWEFKMNCHLCSNKLIIKTDPKNTQYICESGLSRVKEDWIPTEEDGVIILQDKEERDKVFEDPFSKTEHDIKDFNKAKELETNLIHIKQLSDENWKDSYAKSRKLRKIFKLGNDKKFSEADIRKNIL
jgi:coiled-coil domain-containing protein 130